MKSLLPRVAGTLALLVLPVASQAQFTVFTNMSAWLSAVSNPGLDTFNNMPLASVSSPINRSAGSYTYTATASTSNFYPAGSNADKWLSTNTATDNMTFTNFTSTVRGVGAYFFGSNISGQYQTGDIKVTITDGTNTSTQTIFGATTGSFLGFVSNSAILSMTVEAVQPGNNAFLWPTMNDLQLAQAPNNNVVPEPSTYALLATGLFGLGAVARRRRA